MIGVNSFLNKKGIVFTSITDGITITELDKKLQGKVCWLKRNQYLKELISEGFITTEKMGRNKRLYLTSQGYSMKERM